MNKNKDSWMFEITAERKLINLNLKEIWRYKDLLALFVKRDIVTVYKQTILGPLWYFIQPLFTSVVFTLVFNNLGNIQTDGVPPFLFNLAGITVWNYFKECLTNTSNTFTKNQSLFGKVYFPRVIIPMSVTISNLVKLGIQLLIFTGFYFYYYTQGFDFHVSPYALLFPFYIFLMGLMGLGLGMIISSLTTKYRDLSVLVGFATSLLMYVSAVPYPVSEVHRKLPDWVANIVIFNPLTQVIEGFRFVMLGTGTFSWPGLLYTTTVALILFFLGLLIFNRTEKTFIDTV